MKPSVLYLSYTGLLEPLGRSQVLAYLKRLAPTHAITLVTFEKPADLEDVAAMDAARKECREHGIDWVPRRYHHRPRLLATLYDLSVMVGTTLQHTRAGGTELVHCRGYVAALGAWLASRVTRVPFVFDMRALWLDEMILAGRLRPRSLVERVLRRAERRLLRDAAAVVSLTEAAVRYLREQDPALEAQRFVVIPTCVELDRFQAAERAPSIDDDAPVLGSVGTIASGWVPLEALVDLYAELRKARPAARLKVLTRDDPAPLYAELAARGLGTDRVEVQSCTPAEVPAAMEGMTAGVVLFRGSGTGKLGSMPTRMAEFLAAGMPVIGNRGVGDVAELIQRYRVGVVVEEGGADSFRSATEQLLELGGDASMAERCRAAANEYFSVTRGVSRYRTLWEQLVRPETSRDAGLSQSDETCL